MSRATIETSPGRRSFGWPVGSTPGDGEDRGEESVALLAQPGDGLGPLRAGQLVGGRQADGAGHVLRAGPRWRSCVAALLLGEDVRPVADVQRADALRALELVGAERHEVRAERLDVEVDVRRGLDGVDVEDDALAGADPGGDLGDRLDRADLVVGEHDRDQDRLVVERRLELVGIDPAVAVDRQLDDLEAELLEVAQRVADRVVLDRRGDDPVAAAPCRPRRRP